VYTYILFVAMPCAQQQRRCSFLIGVALLVLGRVDLFGAGLVASSSNDETAQTDQREVAATSTVTISHVGEAPGDRAQRRFSDVGAKVNGEKVTHRSWGLLRREAEEAETYTNKENYQPQAVAQSLPFINLLDIDLIDGRRSIPETRKSMLRESAEDVWGVLPASFLPLSDHVGDAPSRREKIEVERVVTSPGTRGTLARLNPASLIARMKRLGDNQAPASNESKNLPFIMFFIGGFMAILVGLFCIFSPSQTQIITTATDNNHYSGTPSSVINFQGVQTGRSEGATSQDADFSPIRSTTSMFSNAFTGSWSIASGASADRTRSQSLSVGSGMSSIADRQRSAKDYADVVVESWDNATREVSDYERILIMAIIEQSQSEYRSMHSRQYMRGTLAKYDIDVERFAMGRGSLQTLQKEVDAERCLLLLVGSGTNEISDTGSADTARKQVVRFVRILRVMITAQTDQGPKVLVEVAREQRVGMKKFTDAASHLLVAKLCIDETDIEESVRSRLDTMLDLSPKKQEEIVVIRKVGDPKVEVQESREFFGLPTWYLCQEVEVDLRPVQGILGLPAGSEFTTESRQSHNRMLKRIHTWAWHSKAPMKNGDDEGDEGGGGSVEDVEQAIQNWAKHALGEWRRHQKHVSDELLAVISSIQQQPSAEYECLNRSDTLDEVLQVRGVSVDTGVLREEIDVGKTLLMLVPNKQDPAGARLGEGQTDLIRFCRVLRVKMRANTALRGEQILIEAKHAREVNYLAKDTAATRFIGFKLCVDEIDIEVALKNLLQLRLNLSPDWQDQYISVRKIYDPKLEVRDSKEFPGLTSWYLVDEMDVDIIDGAVKAGENILGLPAGDQFATKNQKNRNRIRERQHNWCWVSKDPTISRGRNSVRRG
jgi:hypothetical protein